MTRSPQTHKMSSFRCFKSVSSNTAFSHYVFITTNRGLYSYRGCPLLVAINLCLPKHSFYTLVSITTNRWLYSYTGCPPLVAINLFPQTELLHTMYSLQLTDDFIATQDVLFWLLSIRFLKHSFYTLVSITTNRGLYSYTGCPLGCYQSMSPQTQLLHTCIHYN